MKWFFAGFLVFWARFAVGEGLAAQESLPLEVQCLAGTEWESFCHQCRCLPDGTSECHKQESCASSLLGAPISCKPHTIFHRDCNMCRCLVDGQVTCTDKNCKEPNITKRSELLSGRECSSGTKWTSQCNECACNAEGYPVCTTTICPGQENERVLRCAPHSVWKNDCNTCWCTYDGYTICTRVGCIGDLPESDFHVESDDDDDSETDISLSRKTRAAPQEPPKACQPGQVFRLDCNKCLCDNEGQDFSCTRNDCNALTNNINGGARSKRDATEEVSANCTADSVYQQGCNVCRCGADGRTATCTAHNCDAKVDDGVNAPAADPNFRCNPGEQFQSECNDCTCTADGKSVFCTLRLCPVYKP